MTTHDFILHVQSPGPSSHRQLADIAQAIGALTDNPLHLAFGLSVTGTDFHAGGLEAHYVPTMRVLPDPTPAEEIAQCGCSDFAHDDQPEYSPAA